MIATTTSASGSGSGSGIGSSDMTDPMSPTTMTASDDHRWNTGNDFHQPQQQQQQQQQYYSSMSAIKMDELLVTHWLGSDTVYTNVLEWIEEHSTGTATGTGGANTATTTATGSVNGGNDAVADPTGISSITATDAPPPETTSNARAIDSTTNTTATNTTTATTTTTGSNNENATEIPPFYPVGQQMKVKRILRQSSQTTHNNVFTGTTGSATHTTGTGSTLNAKPNDPTSTTTTTNLMDPNNGDLLYNNNNNNHPTVDSHSMLMMMNEDSTNNTTLYNMSTTTTDTNNNNNNNHHPFYNPFSSWDASPPEIPELLSTVDHTTSSSPPPPPQCVRDVVQLIYQDYTHPAQFPNSDNNNNNNNNSTDDDPIINERNAIPPPLLLQPDTILSMDHFHRITKDVCHFPSYFNVPFYQRIIDVWNDQPQPPHGPSKRHDRPIAAAVTVEMLEYYWKLYMEPYDEIDRFFQVIKPIDPDVDYLVRDDFLPFVQALLREHPGLEFLSSHGEFQEKYAVTVITRIFYGVNTDHSGRITARQIRHSDLYPAFQQVDQEDDINKVTRYFSYEHFYVLYCRFWELDHDRDYKITREDLLKYGDHSLSHMIVDRIFDAAPRPFLQSQQQAQQQQQQQNNNNATTMDTDAATTTTTGTTTNLSTGTKINRDFLSYEDFIYFMLSEEDKSNEIAVRYWFQCVDVDGDGKLNNMEMRSFYAVQLHRMSCMGHETVPFEDMLCQMMDMMKPANTNYLVVSDFLQKECRTVSGALFDALFSLNKYMLFEQRDPFNERQKREDEFSTDWDRFACMDYNRLAMEEEAREEEAMEIDWVTVDDDDDDDDLVGGGSGGDGTGKDNSNHLSGEHGRSSAS